MKLLEAMKPIEKTRWFVKSYLNLTLILVVVLPPREFADFYWSLISGYPGTIKLLKDAYNIQSSTEMANFLMSLKISLAAYFEMAKENGRLSKIEIFKQLIRMRRTKF